ncbi:MAG: DsbA family protein [Nanoarchaeota archaeon]
MEKNAGHNHTSPHLHDAGHIHSHESEHTPSLSGTIRVPIWKVLTIIFGIAFVIALVFLMKGSSFSSFNSISGETAGKKIVDFLNMQTNGGVSYVSSVDLGNVYEVTVSFEQQNIPVYVTKDGAYFIQSLVPLNGSQLGGDDSRTPTDGVVDVSVDDDAFLGSKTAPVTIVEFSDYQCPFCEKFWSETLPQLKKEYIDKGKVKLVYRDFPLDIHPDAQKSAEAAECARKIGGEVKYWSMHDKLFANQQALSISDLKKYAQSIGVPAAKFAACLDSSEMSAEVMADLQDGLKYNIDGTPAFFINGNRLIGAQPFSAFKQIIDAELAK